MATALQERVTSLLVDRFGVAESDLQPDRTLGDLSFDSLIVIEFGLSMNKEFGVAIADDELDDEFTVADVVSLLQEKGVAA
ncbi:MAG: acyl carrier protein [Pseudonocardiaceae bacterium]